MARRKSVGWKKATIAFTMVSFSTLAVPPFVDDIMDSKEKSPQVMNNEQDARFVRETIRKLRSGDTEAKIDAASDLSEMALFGRCKKQLNMAILPLAKALTSERDPFVRQESAKALESIAELGIAEIQDAKPALMKSLEDYFPNVRVASARALVKLNDQDAIEVLRKMMKKEKDSFAKRDIELALRSVKD